MRGGGSESFYFHLIYRTLKQQQGPLVLSLRLFSKHKSCDYVCLIRVQILVAIDSIDLKGGAQV